MKIAIAYALLLYAFLPGCTPICGQEGQNNLEKEAREKFQEFFEAFHSKDTLALRSMADQETVLHTVIVRPDGSSMLRESRYFEFLENIASIPDSVTFEERILSVDSRQDRGMVHIWAPYEFYLEGEFSHKGVNSLHLVKENGHWRIVHLIDTRQR